MKSGESLLVTICNLMAIGWFLATVVSLIVGQFQLLFVVAWLMCEVTTLTIKVNYLMRTKK